MVVCANVDAYVQRVPYPMSLGSVAEHGRSVFLRFRSVPKPGYAEELSQPLPMGCRSIESRHAGFRTIAIPGRHATGRTRLRASPGADAFRNPEPDAPGNAGITVCFHSHARGPASLS